MGKTWRLVRRLFAIIVGLAVVATTGAVPAVAQPYEAHTDVEFRFGGGLTCGTCVDKDRFPWRVKTTAQIFVDRLFPVATIGSGAFEIGPYAKGALLAGMNIPQIGGGVAFGYRQGHYEILLNTGFAYASERIDQIHSDRYSFAGQTKHTYDLGLSLRYDIQRYFLSVGYQHNSNGRALGMNFVSGKGSNYGYDVMAVGVGMRF